ncbi:cytochrome b [Aestuariirhabdus litorea]|uniref:Cytochrome b n=1 Tax=Aestuariirhabdus litorea TaxID=2528527 RepID=A0A3P3VLV2_9GAMM|nr:cytochrome b [Aestuariirhabdus litorea]RRJ83404.1 cytochrome b [Aestuariirhabdus litorea]RWW93565.1 cytochrome b [Endozoicomonadaceae bacterium GTF-13]
MLRNSSLHYGWISIILHWLSAVLIVGLFGLGLWMTELGYYDPWYKRGPDLHRSLGLLLFALILMRWLWRQLNPVPLPERSLKPWEVAAAEWAHRATYLLLIAIAISGYLITTAKGDPIWLFDWFAVPALFGEVKGMEDIAGEVHLLLAWTLVVLSAVHALAALKHHFMDGDNTLIRMLGIRSRRNQ